ncbi:MAG: ABC transporter permease [Gammaproteobacteria bacterium]|nr:ABC transporter permease [Gammaproteobacteria bacterium]
MFESVFRDLRCAARALARAPGFTLIAVTVLALGIGVTAAILSLASAVWLRPLPFADADRLVVLWTDLTAVGGPPNVEIAPGNYADWQPRARSFASMSALEPGDFNLTGDGREPERLPGVRATPNLFATIGMAPLLGRTFAPDDGAGEPVAVVSEGFWVRRLGGDPSAIGRSITLDGTPHSIIGVVPRDFRFPRGEIEIFVPTVFPPEVLARRTSYYWYLVARLRDGVTIGAARAEMQTIAATLDRESPNTGRGVAATVVPLREQLANTRTLVLTAANSSTLAVLLGAAGFVLLIACTNVANLMLVRTATRAKELAIRKALGASRGHVLRQLLSESLLLALLGVGVGLVVALACSGYLTRLLPSTLPASMGLALDARTLGITLAAALGGVLLFGVGPALAAARRDFGAVLARTVGAPGTKARRLRTALVVAEIALTVVLLAGAGLLLRSYAAVLAVDPGFRAEGVIVAETVLAPLRYRNPPDRDAFVQRVLERVRALPGVDTAGYTSYAPLTFKGGRSVLFVDGRPRPPPEEMLRHSVSNRGVGAGYLETLGVPLLRGRLIDARDVRGAPPVVVINEALARNEWPGEDPIGQRVLLGVSDGEAMTVVGVVGDVRQMGLDLAAEPEIYVPFHQVTTPFMWPRQLIVRTSGAPEALAPAVRRAIWEEDPDQPISNLRTMREVLDAELDNRNTQLLLLGSFALLALLLAAVGLYGVQSYTVSQSTNEIGLRMALGAKRGAMLGSVLRAALGTALLGIGAGLVAALALTRTIASFLFGVSPIDPWTAAAVAGVLLTVAALATFVPAVRASRIDPLRALREE